VITISAREAEAIRDDLTHKAGHNGPTDDLIRNYARRALDKKRALQEKTDEASVASGEYRSVLKAAKKVGINQGQLARVVADLDRDPEDVKKEEQDYLRIAQLMSMPVTQMDLFPEDAPSPQTSEADDERQVLWSARSAGYKSGLSGHDIDASSPHTTGTEEWVKFREGWHGGQAHLAKGLTRATTRGRKAGGGNPEDRDGA
jgi:hypothetical protein